MKQQQFKLRAVAVAAALVLPMGTAMATNGMLMEGYAAVATSMGGAAQAYDVGNSAMAQNPATLGLQPDGTSRFAFNIGLLRPEVTSSSMGMTSESDGDMYVMPSLGYTKRNGAWTYGIGMYAQGGMGTEYGANSILGTITMDGKPALPARSELGVGNVLIPVVYQVNDKLAIGATGKFVWASLDMMMNATGAQLRSLYAGGDGAFTEASADALSNADWTRLEFSDSGDFSGAAKGNGFGLTLGTTYKVSEKLMLGASYQFKTAISDMETGANGATLSTSFPANVFPVVTGKITVLDFQMPSILAFGASWQATPSVMLAADIKRIGWEDVMDKFRMRLDTAMGSVNFQIDQKWKNQTVLNLGVAWKTSDALTLRAGVNLSDNPVPDQYVHPLFPAIEKNHVTFGFGYKLSKNDMINASWAYAPKVTVTNPGMAGLSPPITISHSQSNLQFGYSHTF